MDIRTQTVTGKHLRELKTEILFSVASARALNAEIFILEIKPAFSDDRESRRKETVGRILKELKKRGSIQFFAGSGDFDSPLTEIEYLKNKYPSIFEIDRGEFFFAVKL